MPEAHYKAEASLGVAKKTIQKNAGHMQGTSKQMHYQQDKYPFHSGAARLI